MEVKNFIPVEGVSQQKKKQKEQICKFSSAKPLTDETINLLNGMQTVVGIQEAGCLPSFWLISPDEKEEPKRNIGNRCYFTTCILTAEKPFGDLSFSKETLFPFFTGCAQLFSWKKILSLLLFSVMKP